jgi:hypothetical protein
MQLSDRLPRLCSKRAVPPRAGVSDQANQYRIIDNLKLNGTVAVA